MTDNLRRKRLLIALTAALAVAAIVLPVLGVLLAPGVLNNKQDVATPVTTTTTTPATYSIKPVALRPVTGAFVITPQDCAAPPPTPPDQPLRTCDILKSAVYELEPEALRLQLTDVDSFLNPLTNKQLVQMTMTAESAKAFAGYTTDHIGQQVAFVRGGVVVWAPKITEPIDGEVLQLSGDVTAEQAGEIARMLREGA
ncbi:SecDF P1 head subdomain-containing protein [Mycolicibacterium sp. CBM1]